MLQEKFMSFQGIYFRHNIAAIKGISKLILSAFKIQCSGSFLRKGLDIASLEKVFYHSEEEAKLNKFFTQLNKKKINKKKALAMKIEITLTSQSDVKEDFPLLKLIKSSRRQSKIFNYYVLLASAKFKDKRKKKRESNEILDRNIV